MSQSDASTSDETPSAPGDRPYEIGFILVSGFALMSFASACEPFRAANYLAGRALYRLRYFAETEGSVASSSGAEIPCEELPRERGHLQTVFVCAGGEPTGWNSPAIHAALRRMARFGVRIGGISGGPYLMAAAGLLADRAFTVHWEYAGATVEAFPGVRLTSARYVADADRLTCGGGVAPLDMAYTLIAERMGAAFARRVSDWFLHTAVGAADDPQRASTAERYEVHHPALLAVIETMEKTVEAPLGRRALALGDLGILRPGGAGGAGPGLGQGLAVELGRHHQRRALVIVDRILPLLQEADARERVAHELAALLRLRAAGQQRRQGDRGGEDETKPAMLGHAASRVPAGDPARGRPRRGLIRRVPA